MTREELLQIAIWLRELYDERAEEFALCLTHHFEADGNPAANVWRSVHGRLKYVPVQAIMDQDPNWWRSTKAQHLNGAAVAPY